METKFIFCSSGHMKNVHFIFYLETDTTVSIACEMVEAVDDLSGEDLVPIVQLMEQLIGDLLLHYRPPSNFSLAEFISSYEKSSGSSRSLDSLRHLLKSGMFNGTTDLVGVGEDHGARESLASGISVELNLMNGLHGVCVLLFLKTYIRLRIYICLPPMEKDENGTN